MFCFASSKMRNTMDGGWVLDASAHLLSRDLVSQSASVEWTKGFYNAIFPWCGVFQERNYRV
jgi:hypothetical protein